MELPKHRIIWGERLPPTKRDRLIVLLISLSFFVGLLPLARPFHGSVVGWIVMLIVIGLPLIIINVLLPFSRWEQHRSEGPPRN